MDVLAKALEGTSQRGNASRQFHISVNILGKSDPIRGVVTVSDDGKSVEIEEFELSKNGQFLAVEAPPIFVVREIITTAQLIYLDGGR